VDGGGNCVHPLVGAPYWDGDVIEENRAEIVGIVLNNPEDMLDPSSQWQIFLQGEGGDTGGTAAWAGAFYQGSSWASELARLNASGFRAGDRVRITGFVAAVGGKANINERHSADPDLNFTVELLDANVGLPAAELTMIAEMNTFDANREVGGERHQGRRIRIEAVNLDSGTWGANEHLWIYDANAPGETLELVLGNLDFGSFAPNTWFHVTGIGNQEPQFSGGPVPGTGLTDGYQVWVTDKSGILAPGDNDEDGDVDLSDLTLLGSHYGSTASPGWSEGDYDEDGDVDLSDLTLLGSNYGYGLVAGGGGTGVPEPASLAVLAAGAAAWLRRRRC
jgi:hypothetical protein